MVGNLSQPMAGEECLLSRVSGFASGLLTKELPKEWMSVQELSSPSAVFSKERAEEVLCWLRAAFVLSLPRALCGP